MTEQDATGPTRWERLAGAAQGDGYAASYAARFRELAASGADLHGEADFVSSLCPPPARVLDAGCGTGRVAIRLAALGHDVVGLDPDDTMLDQARSAASDLDWRLADLASLRLDRSVDEPFDVAVLAGNVVPLVEPDALTGSVAAMADVLTPGGLLVAGFGLDAEHLPAGCPVTPLADWAAALSGAGLEPVSRHRGWDGAAFEGPASGYLVSVDRLGPRRVPPGTR